MESKMIKNIQKAFQVIKRSAQGEVRFSSWWVVDFHRSMGSRSGFALSLLRGDNRRRSWLGLLLGGRLLDRSVFGLEGLDWFGVPSQRKITFSPRSIVHFGGRNSFFFVIHFFSNQYIVSSKISQIQKTPNQNIIINLSISQNIQISKESAKSDVEYNSLKNDGSLIFYLKIVSEMSEKQIKVTISVCSNCRQHQWCTRHNEAMYSSLAVQISKAVQNSDPNIEVQILQVGDQKMGSFEIECNGVLLFSKLSLGYFPHITGVTTRIMAFVDDYRNGRSLLAYTESTGSPVRINSSHHSRSGKSSPKRKIKYIADYKDPSKQQQNPSNFILENSQNVEDSKQQEKKEDKKEENQFILKEEEGDQSAPPPPQIQKVSIKAVDEEPKQKSEEKEGKNEQQPDRKEEKDQPQQQNKNQKEQESKQQEKKQQKKQESKEDEKKDESPDNSHPPNQTTQQQPQRQNHQENIKKNEGEQEKYEADFVSESKIKNQNASNPNEGEIQNDSKVKNDSKGEYEADFEKQSKIKNESKDQYEADFEKDSKIKNDSKGEEYEADFEKESKVKNENPPKAEDLKQEVEAQAA